VIAATFLVALAAFVLFALATDRQHCARFGKPVPARRQILLRIGAWSCVAFDFALAWAAWGAVFGPVGWAAMLMAGAAVSFIVLNFLLSDHATRR
jgi:hypothetical protein